MLGHRGVIRNDPIQGLSGRNPPGCMALTAGEHGFAARRPDRSHNVRTTPKWVIDGRTRTRRAGSQTQPGVRPEHHIPYWPDPKEVFQRHHGRLSVGHA